jgi:hypothetical protein
MENCKAFVVYSQFEVNVKDTQSNLINALVHHNQSIDGKCSILQIPIKQ